MIAALVVLFSVAPVPMKKPVLEFTVALDKVTYKADDKVVLAFELKNRTTAELWIGDGYPAPVNHEVGPGRHFELRTADKDGNALHFWNNHLTEGRTSGVRKVFKLKPGESYRGTIIISEGGFATVKTDTRHKLGVDTTNYTVKLVYQVNPKSHSVWEPAKDFDEEKLWHGVIMSNTVSLTFK